MPTLIRYRFSQYFNVSAQEAFGWCTDFSPQDLRLMNLEEDAVREITKISESTTIIKDAIQTSVSAIVKEKLVQLYPDRLMWVSTQLSGPNRYSQFFYQINVESKDSSHLDFTGLHIEYKDHMSPKEIKELSERLCSFDMKIWRLLATAMHKDLTF